MCKTGDELTENRREDDEVFKREMVFEKGGPYCPVASLEPYIKHSTPRMSFCSKGQRKEVKSEWTMFVLIIWRLVSARSPRK